MRVVIAGGGTGGHLFPGIAIAREFMRSEQSNRIMFIGTRKGIEGRVIPQEGFPIRYLLSGGIKNTSPLKKIVSLCKLPVSIAQSICYLAGFRPDMVIGVGGYSSGPVGFSSFLLRIPLAVQEQNLLSGLTNTILARLADVIFTSFEGTADFFRNRRVYCTGNPIRREIYDETGNWKLETGERGHRRFTLLIFGGSQGARSINRAVLSALKFLDPVKEKIQLIHQTGEADFAEVNKGYQDSGFQVEVSPFIQDMARAYRRADLVISRAGATTLAEITATGKPAILVPFPYAANNHQEYNARELEEKGGAHMILESRLSGRELADYILRLLNHPEEMVNMGRASAQCGRPDAAEEIVRICYELVNRN